MKHEPQVGLGIMIWKDGKVLLGKRMGSHGAGEYSFPGGHLEHLESFEDSIVRETNEETGLRVKNLKFLYVTNCTKYAPKHYVNLDFTADWDSGEPQVLEPEKVESWGWYSLENLPEPISPFVELALDSYKNNKVYYSSEKDIVT